MPEPHSRARPRLGRGTSGELPDVEITGAVVFVIGLLPGLGPG
jgi:hypothetical protein